MQLSSPVTEVIGEGFDVAPGLGRISEFQFLLVRQTLDAVRSENIEEHVTDETCHRGLVHVLHQAVVKVFVTLAMGSVIKVKIGFR